MADVPRPKRQWNNVLVFSSAVLLVIGWFAPAYSVSRSLGEPVVTALVNDLFPELLRTERKSLFGTMRVLLTSGSAQNAAIGVAVFVFTFLFPSAKLCLIYLRDNTGVGETETGRRIANAGKWSMVEVLMVAIILVSFADFKGLVFVTVEWGIVAFGASVILSIVAGSAESRSTAE